MQRNKGISGNIIIPPEEISKILLSSERNFVLLEIKGFTRTHIFDHRKPLVKAVDAQIKDKKVPILFSSEVTERIKMQFQEPARIDFTTITNLENTYCKIKLWPLEKKDRVNALLLLVDSGRILSNQALKSSQENGRTIALTSEANILAINGPFQTGTIVIGGEVFGEAGS